MLNKNLYRKLDNIKDKKTKQKKTPIRSDLVSKKALPNVVTISLPQVFFATITLKT